MRCTHGKIALVFRIVPLLIVAGMVNLRAQDSSGVIKNYGNGLHKGSWALQFAIVNDFQLKDFQGATISIKRHYSESRAIRLGLALSESSNNYHTSEVFIEEPDYRNESINDQNNDRQGVGVYLQYIMYPTTHSNIHPYWGLGPHLGYSRDKTVIHNRLIDGYDPTIRETVDDNIQKSWTLGLSSIMGVEWFAGKNISLTAEYGILADYIWSKNVSTRIYYPGSQRRTSETKRNSFSFSGTAVKFGLAAYF